MTDDEGEVNMPLICDRPNRPRQMVDHEHGKPALTRFRVLHRDVVQQLTRVELMPVTGRSHQLRVHMLALGHAILGATLYTPETRSEERRVGKGIMIRCSRRGCTGTS